MLPFQSDIVLLQVAQAFSPVYFVQHTLEKRATLTPAKLLTFATNKKYDLKSWNVFAKIHNNCSASPLPDVQCYLDCLIAEYTKDGQKEDKVPNEKDSFLSVYKLPPM